VRLEARQSLATKCETEAKQQNLQRAEERSLHLPHNAVKTTSANTMSGRGKGGKGLGKGGAKRHRKVLRDNIQGAALLLHKCWLVHGLSTVSWTVS